MRQPKKQDAPLSAAELLRRGREAAPLRYDTEGGLSRHRALALSAAPLPDWAGPTAKAAAAATKVATTIAGKAMIASVVVVSSAAVATWGYTVARSTAPAVPESVAPVLVPSARTRESPSVAAVPSAVPLDALPRASVGAPTRTRGDQGQKRILDERPAATPSANAVPAARVDLAETPGGSPPAPSARRTEDTAEEVAVVAEAERLVGSNPARALTLVRSLDSRAPAGFLREERQYVATMALLQMNAPGARDQARRFLQSYPASPYAQRIRAKIGALAEP